MALLGLASAMICFGGATQAWAADPQPGPLALVLTSYARPIATARVQTSDGQDLKLLVKTPGAAASLASAHPADTLDVTVDDLTAPKAIVAVLTVSRPVAAWDVALAVGASILGLVAAAYLASWGRPLSLVIGADGRVSNSQVQLAAWFGVVACAYAAAVCLRVRYLGWDHVGGVNVTDHVMALSGLSALTFGGAKAIGVQKARAAAAKNLVMPRGQASLLDLARNDFDQTDLGDFQMILITLTACAIFAVATVRALLMLPVVDIMKLPDVDTTLLSGFGLGQGAYLIKKAVLPPGHG